MNRLRYPRQQLQRGRSTLEFAVIVLVAGVLMWFLISSLGNVQAQAERTLVDVTIRDMRTGLQLKITEMIVAGHVNQISNLVGQNPLQWAPQAPDGYAGEVDQLPTELKGRGWYFEKQSRRLIYVPGSAELLDGSTGKDYLAWRVEAGVGGREGGIMGVRMVAVP